MTEHVKLPDAVARMLEIAQLQRGQFAADPDPLTIAEPERPEPALKLSQEEKLEECAAEPETDIGNARRLLIRYGDVIRYVQNVGWHAYFEGRWKEDVGDVIVRRHAQVTAEFIDDEAILLDCSEEEQQAIAAGRKAQEDLKSMGKPPGEAADAGDFDADEALKLIEAGKEAEKKKVKLGAPKPNWDDEKYKDLDALKAAIRAGSEAKKALEQAQKKGASAWTAERLTEYEKLQRLLSKMSVVQSDRNGRMSSRHGHAKSSAGTSKINNMLTETAPHVSLTVDELNRDLHAVNCKSGTLRFFRGADGKWQVRLDDHDPLDLISKCAEVQLVKDAVCPRFENFFKQVMPDVDLRAFIQRFAGYCLLGLTGEQCLLFFYGAGRNGKSTFVDILTEILGDYAVSMSIDSFAGDTRRGGAEATPDLARLPGARLVAASEPEMGVKLKDALIKTLTGGEAIAVRRLHQDFFELVPQFKIILSGNHKPIIHDDSDGIWRRVHLVPWEVQIPEDQVDIDLKAKLLTEREGIFSWLIKGALDYLNGGLRVPARVTAATAEYREENDPIGAFLRNGCHITGKDEDQESPKDLFDAYCAFARREGLAEFKSATFSKRLPDQTRKTFRSPEGTQQMFRKGKSGTTVYYGIRVKDEYRAADDRNPPPYGGSYEDDLPDGF